MSPSALYPRDKTRLTAMVDWCDQVGVPVRFVPQEPGALTVTPLNEGELLAAWIECQHDDQGPIIAPDGSSVLRLPGHQTMLVVDAPPGFRPPVWDAWAYVQYGEDVTP